MKLFIWKRFRDEEGLAMHLLYTNNSDKITYTMQTEN